MTIEKLTEIVKEMALQFNELEKRIESIEHALVYDKPLESLEAVSERQRLAASRYDHPEHDMTSLYYLQLRRNSMEVCFVCEENAATCTLDGYPACGYCRDRVLHNRVQNSMKASPEDQAAALERMFAA